MVKAVAVHLRPLVPPVLATSSLAGAGPESKRSVSDAWFYYELAREHKALLVCLEHRFYGGQ